jgi:SNF2 family DNA or RNA helicase
MTDLSLFHKDRSRKDAGNNIQKIIQTSIDLKIWNQLHEHQKEGAEFLVGRLLSDRFPSNDRYESVTIRNAGSVLPETGAVLADEMGTGKVSSQLHFVFTNLILFFVRL